MSQMNVIALGQLTEIAFKCSRKRGKIIVCDLKAATVATQIDWLRGAHGIALAQKARGNAAKRLDCPGEDAMGRPFRDFNTEVRGNPNEIRCIGRARKACNNGKLLFRIDKQQTRSIQ